MILVKKTSPEVPNMPLLPPISTDVIQRQGSSVFYKSTDKKWSPRNRTAASMNPG